MTTEQVLTIIAGVVGVASMIFFAIVGKDLRLYILARISDAHVPMLHLLGMRLRKVDARTIVLSRIRARKAGLELSADRLETHYLAGGRVVNVCTALISAKGAKLPLTWEQAASMDLGGEDPFEWVQKNAATQRERAAERRPTAPKPSADSDSPPERSFAEAIVGMQGLAHSELSSTDIGRVKIGGKIMSAMAPDGQKIMRGAFIRVTAVHPSGVLFVQPDT